MPHYLISFHSELTFHVTGTLKVEANDEEQAIHRAERFLPPAINITSISLLSDETEAPAPDGPDTVDSQGHINQTAPPA